MFRVEPGSQIADDPSLLWCSRWIEAADGSTSLSCYGCSVPGFNVFVLTLKELIHLIETLQIVSRPLILVLRGLIFAAAELDVSAVNAVLIRRNFARDFGKADFDRCQIEGTTADDQRSPVLQQSQSEEQIRLTATRFPAQPYQVSSAEQ